MQGAWDHAYIWASKTTPSAAGKAAGNTVQHSQLQGCKPLNPPSYPSGKIHTRVQAFFLRKEKPDIIDAMKK